MQTTRKIIKVFIASPGDLGDERTIAREIGEEFNSSWAESTGYQIEMVGWEETTGGIGRPQEIINRDLARCELFIGMLWRRWGTPPDNCGRFTSGFEEEFSISLDRYKKEGVPQICMFFKEVDKDSLRDPGSDLQKVIKFKDNLINGKEILFETFTNPKDFEKKLRRRINSYVVELTSKDLIANSPEDSNDSSSIDKNVSVLGDNKQFFSNSTASFVSDFINDLQCSGYDAASPEKIAFFRLVSTIINSSLNDNDVIGAHDSNLLYRHANLFKFGQRELSGLILSGVDGFDSRNAPLWKWVSESKLSMEMYTVLSKDERKRKAIDAMRLIAYDIKNDRDSYLNEWLVLETNDNVKVSALKYLGDTGTLSDIPIIIKEYERNEVRTNSSAVDAIIAITFRYGVVKGFDAIVTYQPSSVNYNILDELYSKESLLDTKIIAKGLNNKNNEIRIFCAESLIKRNVLDEAQLEELLDHEDYNVRYLAINKLSEINYKLYKAKAENILTKKIGDNKDEIYLKYVSFNLFRESFESLVELGKRPYMFKVDHLVALAKKDSKNVGKLREIISDGGLSYLSNLSENMSEFGVDEFEQFLKSYGDFIKREVLFSCAEYVCGIMKKEDLNLLRGYLSSKNCSLSIEMMRFFKKNGDFDDVYKLCNSKIKTNGTLLAGYSNESKKSKVLAETVLFLSKSKERELLDIEMPVSLKIDIISQMAPGAFKKIPMHNVFKLLNIENAILREKVCQKIVESLSKPQMQKTLEDYYNQDTYYYNVIYWLDFGINVSKDVSRRAIKKILAS